MQTRLRFVVVAVFLFISAALVTGCETTKGVAEGVGVTVGGTATGIAKDSAAIWTGILKTDSWIKKNLW